MKRYALTLLIFSAALATIPARAGDFAMPKLVPASAMARRDPHPQEKITLGAEAYESAEKAKLFKADMRGHGVLPVLIVFTNEGEQPVVLNQARFQLVTRDRAKADPYSIDDLQRAFTAIKAPGSRGRDQLPIPLPGNHKAHGGLSKENREQMEQAIFAARAVEPHASQQGFLFFDVTGLERPAQGARLYVTGVKDQKGNELMYFEVELGEPQVSASPGN